MPTIETIAPSGKVSISKNRAAPPPSPPVLNTFPPIGVAKMARAIGDKANKQPVPDSHLPTRFFLFPEISAPQLLQNRSWPTLWVPHLEHLSIRSPLPYKENPINKALKA